MLIKKEYLYVIAVCLALLIGFNLLIHKDISVYGGADKEYYISTASNPNSDSIYNHSVPFSYRIAFPYLVFGLNKFVDNLDLSFRLLTNLFLLITMFLLFYYLFKIKKFSYKKAILGVCVFAFIPYLLTFNLYDFYLVDALLYVFIILFFIFLESNFKFRILILSLIIALGTLVKEFVLVFVPVFFFYDYFKTKNFRLSIKNSFLIGIFGTIIFILLHIFISVVDINSYFLSTFTGIFSKFLTISSNPLLFVYLSLSVFWVFVFVNFVKIKEYFFKSYILVYFIITIILGLLVNDFHRVFVYLFPIFIPLIVFNISNLWNKSKHWKYFIVFSFCLQLLLLIVRYTIGYSFGLSLIWPDILFLIIEIISLFFTLGACMYFIVKHIKSK